MNYEINVYKNVLIQWTFGNRLIYYLQIYYLIYVQHGKTIRKKEPMP